MTNVYGKISIYRKVTNIEKKGVLYSKVSINRKVNYKTVTNIDEKQLQKCKLQNSHQYIQLTKNKQQKVTNICKT